MWVHGGWKMTSTTTPEVKSLKYTEQSLYAEVGESVGTGTTCVDNNGLLTTCVESNVFNNGFGRDPEPYATTTLAMQNRVRNLVSKVRIFQFFWASY